MFRPMASSAKNTAWKPSADLPATASALRRSPMVSADPCAAAQDPLGPDDEDDDQEQEPADVLDVAGHDQRRHLDEHPHDDAADQGAVGGAETAEGHPREHQQQQTEAHVPLHL